MEKQGCGLIKDLLKLYSAGDITDESISCIEAHAEDCPQCRMKYSAVKRGVGVKEIQPPVKKKIIAPSKAEARPEQTEKKPRTALIVAIICTFPLWLPLALVLLALLAAFIAAVFVTALVVTALPFAFAAASLFSLVAFVCALFRVDLSAAVIALGASLGTGGLMLALGLPCIRLCRLLLQLISLVFSAFLRLITGGSIGSEE